MNTLRNSIINLIEQEAFATNDGADYVVSVDRLREVLRQDLSFEEIITQNIDENNKQLFNKRIYDLADAITSFTTANECTSSLTDTLIYAVSEVIKEKEAKRAFGDASKLSLSTETLILESISKTALWLSTNPDAKGAIRITGNSRCTNEENNELTFLVDILLAPLDGNTLQWHTTIVREINDFNDGEVTKATISNTKTKPLLVGGLPVEYWLTKNNINSTEIDVAVEYYIEVMGDLTTLLLNDFDKDCLPHLYYQPDLANEIIADLANGLITQ